MEKVEKKSKQKTYSEATKSELTETFQEVLKEENKKAKNQDKFKEMTKCNLIIKRIYDPANIGKTKEEIQQEDRKSIKKLLKDLNKPNIEPLYITRVGKLPTPMNRSPRPTKIVLKNEREMKDILESVKLLKNKNTGICVTEDLTWEERLIMK